MTPGSSGPAPQAADALVVFGATGDLARKKIFPALHAMSWRGAPQVANNSGVETYCAPRVHIDSWGPAAANHFIAADGGWRNPEPARTEALP